MSLSAISAGVSLPSSTTASHDNHEKILSWVSFSLLCKCGAFTPLKRTSIKVIKLIAPDLAKPCEGFLNLGDTVFLLYLFSVDGEFYRTEDDPKINLYRKYMVLAKFYTFQVQTV